VACFFKKRPPSHDSGDGYVNSETALTPHPAASTGA
jgi:hypothetical protein